SDIEALNVGLVQQTGAQFTPSSAAACKSFADAYTKTKTVMSSWAFQFWHDDQARLADAVWVFKTVKAAQKAFKPYRNATASKACIAAGFMPSAGNPTTVTVSVRPQRVKLRGATELTSYLVNATFSLPGRTPLMVAAQTLVVRYKAGIINTEI